MSVCGYIPISLVVKARGWADYSHKSLEDTDVALDRVCIAYEPPSDHNPRIALTRVLQGKRSRGRPNETRRRTVEGERGRRYVLLLGMKLSPLLETDQIARGKSMVQWETKHYPYKIHHINMIYTELYLEQ